MELNKSKIAFYGMVCNYIGKIISSIFIALTFIIIVKAFSVVSYGKYTIYINAVFFATLLLDFGIAEVVLRYVPEYIETNKISLIKGLVKLSILLTLGLTAFFLLLALGIRIFMPGLIARFNLNNILFFLIIFGWLRITTQIFANILNAFLFQVYRISCEVFINILRFILVFMFLKIGVGAWNLIVLYAYLDCLLILIYYFKIRQPIKGIIPKYDTDSFKKMRRFGLNEYFYKLFWFFTDNRFDIYIVGLLLGSISAGYLAFAAGILNMLIDWSPGFIIRPIVAPLFIRLYTAKKDIAQIQHLFQLHNKFLVFTMLPIFIFLAILIDKIIIYIFDPKYLPSLGAFFIFIFSMFFINIIIPLRNIIALMERADISNLSNVAAIPKIFLVVILAKFYGINGAAMGYAISLCLIVFINLFLIKKIINLKYPWEAFLKIAINTAISGITLYSMRVYINSRIDLFLVAGIGFIVYLIAAYINKAFSHSDREIFNRALKIPIWNF